MLSRVLLLSLIVLGVATSPAAADWREFIPRTIENGADLDIYTSYERDHLDSGNRPLRWNDTFVREKLTLFSNGYSYHPRFLQYQFSIGGAFKQEDYEASYADDRGWRTGEGLEYGLRLFLLPEHSYNLTAFALRYQPLFKEQAAPEHSSVGETYGTSFRYRKKPYFVHAGYIDNHVDSGETSSDVQRVNLDGEYFKRFVNGNEVSLTAAFNPSWFSNSEGLDGSSNQYLLGNVVNLQRVRLFSSLTRQDWDQDSELSGKFENDQWAWYELLNTYLPWNFRTDLSYRYQDNDGTIDQPAPLPDRTLSDTSKDLRFDLVHRLYESLDSSYSLWRGERDYSSGDTTTLAHSGALNYTKVIPWGRLMAGTNIGRADTDNSGQGSVINEPHVAVPVPGSFVLGQQNVDPTSIIIFLRSPLPPFQLVRLVENVDYLVVPMGNSLEIRVISLPPGYVIPGVYDFVASYVLTGGDYELRTDTHGGTVSAQLFNNLLTPYFSYSAVRSDVLSGDYPSDPVDSTTYTGGLTVMRGPWRARGEYQQFEWEVAPSQTWRAELQYVGPINPTTSLYATVAYSNKHYGSGTLVTYGTESAYTQETVSGTGTLQKQLPLRNMFASVGGSYSHQDGQVITNAYSGNASLSWKIGRVDLALGASAYGSDTSGGGIVSSERDHQLLYLKLRRRLF